MLQCRDGPLSSCSQVLSLLPFPRAPNRVFFTSTFPLRLASGQSLLGSRAQHGWKAGESSYGWTRCPNCCSPQPQNLWGDKAGVPPHRSFKFLPALLILSNHSPHPIPLPPWSMGRPLTRQGGGQWELGLVWGGGEEWEERHPTQGRRK